MVAQPTSDGPAGTTIVLLVIIIIFLITILGLLARREVYKYQDAFLREKLPKATLRLYQGMQACGATAAEAAAAKGSASSPCSPGTRKKNEALE